MFGLFKKKGKKPKVDAAEMERREREERMKERAAELERLRQQEAEMKKKEEAKTKGD